MNSTEIRAFVAAGRHNRPASESGKGMRAKGKIASWNDDKGYGFIQPLAGGKQVFVHINAFRNRVRRPEINDIVSFGLTKDKQGRPCATAATLAGDKLAIRAPRTTRTGKQAAIGIAVLMLGAVGVSTTLGELPAAVGIAYGALSLTAFVIYGIDKSAARRGHSRTPETTLLLIGLAGGWPGALIAQQVFRHKTAKTSFRVQFWITVVINCGILVWLHSEGGRMMVAGL